MPTPTAASQSAPRPAARFVDLHCHSTASDGTRPPAEVVREAAAAGLSAIALTDHDTVAGCAEAAAEARKLGIDFLSGIEISAAYPRPGTMHILGYGVDPSYPALADLTRRLQAARRERNLKIVDTLRARGVAITMAEVEAAAGLGDDGRPVGVVGRPHFAKVLIDKGYCKTNGAAFAKYLGQGGSAYVDKEQFGPAQAIDLIHRSGGLASVAHPKQLQKQNDAQLAGEIKNLADAGLDALEVIHSDHRESYVDFLSDLADRFGLLKTGGSDYHGSNKPHITMGRAGIRRVPRAFYDGLVERLASLRRAG